MYRAPLDEQLFVLETSAALLAGAAFDPEIAAAILSGSARVAEDIFAPLNAAGDRTGTQWQAGEVRTPPGFAAAYRRYVEDGWAALGGEQAFGGQAMPFALCSAAMEQFTSANAALSGCMMLSQGAIEALQAHGSDAQKQLYLHRLVSGEWTGTMNLTEPQAGTDVGAIRTVAEPRADGSYHIRGQKIFITWGEHDMADNIVHLVLARTPGAPAGTRGISLFVVPKYLPGPDGLPGARNDLRCVSVEHKLGIRASATCTMSYGDEGGATGFLVGAEHGGMKAMFTMMNHARVNVALQGVAVAERARQAALDYARERVQSAKRPGGVAVPIIEHADVRRMLLVMRAHTEAARAIVYLTATAIDCAENSSDADARAEAQGLADLLTPVAKAYASDIGVEVASSAIQVFGGMGFIEESGVAQYYRDARIAPIYEGTNGVQALDLVNRKLPAENGRHWRALLAGSRRFLDKPLPAGPLAALGEPLRSGLDALETATHWMAGRTGSEDAAAGATPYLRLFASTLGAILLARQAQTAQAMADAGRIPPSFAKAKQTTAAFYAEQLLPSAAALLTPVMQGASLLEAFGNESD